MGILRDIMNEPIPDAMRKAENSPGGYFRLYLGGNAYLRDDFMNAANDAEPHLSSPAVEVLYEMLSGFRDIPMQGSSWLPVEDAEKLAHYCKQNHFVCTFVSFDDPNLAEKIQACKDIGIAIGISVPGPFSAVAEEIDWDTAIAATAKGERTLFDGVAQKCLETVFAAGEAGADCIVIADEVASVEGPLAAPGFVPVLADLWRQMVENGSAVGVPTIFHSDGDISDYCPALADAGFSGVHVACGSDFDRIAAVYDAIAAAELIPLGGVPALALEPIAQDLESSSDQRETIQKHIETLAAAHPACIITDDGGMTTLKELDAYARVY